VHDPPPDAEACLYEAGCLAAASHAIFEYEDPDYWIATSKAIRGVELTGPYPETSVRVRWWDRVEKQLRFDSCPLWRAGAPFWADSADPVAEIATSLMRRLYPSGRSLTRRRPPLTITAAISKDLLADPGVYAVTCLAAVCDALFDYQGLEYWVKDHKDVRGVELLGVYPDTQLRVRWYDRITRNEYQLRGAIWTDGRPPPGAPDPITEIALYFMDEMAENRGRGGN